MKNYGSLNNLLLNRTKSKEDIKIGDGATEILWTDRQAYTVIGISDSCKTIKVQRDKPIRIDSNGMSDMQSYVYQRDYDGVVYTVRKNKNGQWKYKSRVFVIGLRDEYYDYSF